MEISFKNLYRYIRALSVKRYAGSQNCTIREKVIQKKEVSLGTETLIVPFQTDINTFWT